MNLDIKKIIIAGCVLLAFIGVIALLFSFLKNFNGSKTSTSTPAFGTPPNGSGVLLQGAGALPDLSVQGNSAQEPPIFEISSGPVIAATFMQAGSTTVARYVMGDSGHVYDFAVNAPNARAVVVSNTTLPGIQRAVWVEGGRGVIVQYLEDGVIKTVYRSLPAASAAVSAGGASSGATSTITYFPDNIESMTASPNGQYVAYLLQTTDGSAGYIANFDGTGSTKSFALPISQVSLSWASPHRLIAQSKASSGAPGIAFAVNTQTGAVEPLLYGAGLTLTANPDLSYVLYRTDTGTGASLYSYSVASGSSTQVLMPPPFDAPLPAQCAWSTATTTIAYCGVPDETLPGGYLDRFYRGEYSVADVLMAIDAANGLTVPVASPGTSAGGEPSDMISLSLSPNGKYLSFVAKDDQTLWGVRLTQ